MPNAKRASGPLIAQVVPLLRVRHLGDRAFDYQVPPELEPGLIVGSVVAVPFGARKVRGVVTKVFEGTVGGVEALRPLDSVERGSVGPELMQLAAKVADRYLASLESCLRLVVPPASTSANPRRLATPPQRDTLPGRAPELGKQQQEAVARLSEDLRSDASVHRQLWGVTGSGKTEVYLRLAQSALERGAGVIMMVPEIALTPLMIERVRARLGEEVGVLHSSLTPAQRRHEYERIASGQARVVVGARSAIFAPVNDLRLVILDESHDTSYKQEEAPAYHARTVAQLRLEGTGGLLLEGSASPAVEAMVEPQNHIRLTERPRGALPVCEVVDMRQQAHKGVLAAYTTDALARTLRKGEQAIVLLNRRGHSGYVHCESCGHVMTCDDCELALTYHSSVQRLLCHHCNRSLRQPALCPQCKETSLTRGGPGTERLAEELSRLVPEDRVYRLDSDVLTSGARVRSVLEEFAKSRPAVLVGTQMVAKGHDFPDVTLVVVANADSALYTPDFRAAERTFQLLIQVSGRAGRAERPGKVLVQTWNPEVPCIRMALDRDENGFYSRELGLRQRLGYPPFTQLIRLLTVGERVQSVELAARHLAEGLRPHFGERELRGPVRLPALRGKCRWHIVLSSEDGERARAVVKQAMDQLAEPYRKRGVRLLVDVDPFSFM